MGVNKILLINPPGKCYLRKDLTLGERKHCTPPLGLAYLAANLLRHSYEVEVLDMLAEGYQFEQVRGSFVLYGLSIEDTLERIRKYQPDLIGLSLLFSNRVQESNEIIRSIKSEFPDVLIVLGGQHPTGLPMGSIRTRM